MNPKKIWTEPDAIVDLAKTLMRARPPVIVLSVFFFVAAGHYVLGVFAALTVLGPSVCEWRWKALRKRELESIRPRFGHIHRDGGEDIPLVFYPVTGQPGKFCGYHAGDESAIVPQPGDQVCWDTMTEGQSIIFGLPREATEP